MRDAALVLRSLRKCFCSTVAVDNLDLTVGQGECFGLLGPNGAGKTTTIEICEGLTEADSGTVELLGLNWRRHGRELRQRLGIQIQETCLAGKLTVVETLRLFRSFYRQGPSVDQLIALVQLEEKRSGRVEALSGGQKQRLALGCALAGDPELLFLDEPTTGLDPQARIQFWSLIERFKDEGRTIVLTTHYIEEAERLCDCVAIMNRVKVIAKGSPRDLIGSIGEGHILEYSSSASPAKSRVRVRDLHLAVPAILQDLDRQSHRLTELTMRPTTLEDVFITLTGRSLRDG